jgi:hypothetical protein
MFSTVTAKEHIMATHATRRNFGRHMYTSLAKAVFVLLGLVLLAYLAVAADGNSRYLRDGFSGHATASQMSRGSAATGAADAKSISAATTSVPPPSQWDVGPYVNPAAKMAEPIATF